MATISPESFGYMMSSEQLNELWHYEMWLAHNLMDLPLRTCSAVPMVWPDPFRAMGSTEFWQLKTEIRRMWIFAALHFNCKKGQHGWGLFYSNTESGIKPFSGGKDVVMGWLVKLPSDKLCPTSHRYLRSPCESTGSYYIYLGGPISLANYDEVSRVNCTRCLSTTGPRKNKVAVSKVQSRKVEPGQEVLWTYNKGVSGRKEPHFYEENEWKLDTCCSEKEGHGSFSASGAASAIAEKFSHETLVKKRKVAGFRPLKTSLHVPSYRECTYCGENVTVNLKRHWALKHSIHVCAEMGVSHADVESPVCPKEFMKHIDKLDHVYNSLRNHGYKIVPSCAFFDNTNTPVLLPEASDRDKEIVFEQFVKVAKTLFHAYKIIYLTGISIPAQYEDLLKKDPDFNYSKVSWVKATPSTSNFSLGKYDLSEDEQTKHERSTHIALVNAVVAWE